MGTSESPPPTHPPLTNSFYPPSTKIHPKIHPPYQCHCLVTVMQVTPPIVLYVYTHNIK